MRPKERRDSGQNDLLRARLDQIVDLDHPLAKLGRALNWRAPSPIRSCSPAGCASSASISAEKRACPRAPSRGSIRCTRPRSNVSARACPRA